MLKYTAYVHLEMTLEKFSGAYSNCANLFEKINGDPNWIRRNIEVNSLQDASYLAVGWAKVLEIVRQRENAAKNEDESFYFNESKHRPYIMFFDHQSNCFELMKFD